MFTMLLVDDNHTNCFTLMNLIEKADPGTWNFVEAQDGIEALELLEIIHIDAVITDIKMPRMSGIELLQEMKNRKYGMDVVIVSSSSSFEFTREVIALGAFDYLLKPLKVEKLASLIGSLKQSIADKNRANIASAIQSDKAGSVYLNDLAATLLGQRLDNKETSDLYVRKSIESLFTISDNDFFHAEGSFDMLCQILNKQILDRYPWFKNFYETQPIPLDLFNDEKARQNLIDKLLFQLSQLDKYIKRFYIDHPDSTISKICSHIAEHCDEKLSLGQLAASFGFNTDYAGKLLKSKIGTNFGDFSTMVKMERAKFLLQYKKYKIYDVCNMLGYKDTNYFSELFKKVTGSSPSSFRNDN